VNQLWAGVYSHKTSPKSSGTPRQPNSDLQPIHADLAASVQARLEECYFELLNAVYERTKLPAVCLAGGVALNCVANGKIFERTSFQDVYVHGRIPMTPAHRSAPLSMCGISAGKHAPT